MANILKSFIFVGLFFGLGCETATKKTPPENTTGAKTTPAKKTGQPSKPAGKPPAKKLKPLKRETYAGSHILLQYKGSMRASPKVTRSKEEAQKEAAKIAKLAQASPDKFAELAKKHSDGPTGPSGGDLGTWQSGRMHPKFDGAVAALKEGQVSGVVETPFGFHVIKRNKLLPAVKLTASHLVVAYKGATRANKTVTRTKEEAQKLAEKLAKQAKAAPAKFADLIKKHSDGPRAKVGGSLGTWNSQRSMMPAQITKSVRALKEGEVSGAVETPFGFHIFKRHGPPPKYAGAHILISYKGAMRAKKSITRSKAEAKKEAARLVKEARKNPGKFAELAGKHSDGPSKVKGGSLGVWEKGRMVPAFDAAIEKMKVGGISDPVETPFGFHVIKRNPLPPSKGAK